MKVRAVKALLRRFSLHFLFATLLSLLFSLTTGLSCVTILANASCTVGSNVYDADFILATIWLISFAYALIVNNNNNNNNNDNSESSKIYNDNDNISMMPTIILMMMMMMSLSLLTIVYRSGSGKWWIFSEPLSIPRGKYLPLSKTQRRVAVLVYTTHIPKESVNLPQYAWKLTSWRATLSLGLLGGEKYLLIAS